MTAIVVGVVAASGVQSASSSTLYATSGIVVPGSTSGFLPTRPITEGWVTNAPSYINPEYIQRDRTDDEIYTYLGGPFATFGPTPIRFNNSSAASIAAFLGVPIMQYCPGCLDDEFVQLSPVRGAFIQFQGVVHLDGELNTWLVNHDDGFDLRLFLLDPELPPGNPLEANPALFSSPTIPLEPPIGVGNLYSGEAFGPTTCATNPFATDCYETIIRPSYIPGDYLFVLSYKSGEDFEVSRLHVELVPAPAAMGVFASSLIGLAIASGRRKRGARFA
ncbi:hypothetical protein [Falsiroseomonas bella]|uniref:hypothetical protein n=1 Tax=Falsiroseomonas bella TaxID=2184016 RepID=UPI0011B4881A|nr:hypothetical protein [Falsiroseomonas bella]